MKKQILLFAGLLIASLAFSQAPASFKYQAVARDASGAILANKAVSFRFSIIEGTVTGDIVYSEKQNTVTNAFGLVNLEIGRGTVLTGSMESINWGIAPHFTRVEMDPNGGTDFQLLGTSELLSVPYALHAKTVENDTWGRQTAATDLSLNGNGTAADPLKIAQQSAIFGNVLKWNGTAWNPAEDLVGNSFWAQDGNNIYYNTGKVGIGRNPGADTRQFQVITGDMQAVGANNNSAGWPAIFAENTGGGLAAEFRSPVRIMDGTQGLGKLLTSDANGNASWQAAPSGPWLKNGTWTYYNQGNVGIGTSTPDFDLTILGNSGSEIHLTNAFTGNTTTDGMRIGANGGSSWLWNYENMSMQLGTNNLACVVLTQDGNTLVTGNLSMNLGKKISVGVDNPTSSLELNGGYATWAKFYHTSSGTNFTDGLLVGIQEAGNRAYLWNYENGPLTIATNNTSRILIAETGEVGIGTATPTHLLDVAGVANLNSGIASGQALLVNGHEAIWFNGTYYSWGYGSTYNYFARPACIGTSTDPGSNYLVVNGPAAKPGGGSWATWSDIRLKNLHGNYDKGLNEIARLQPVNFTYKEGNPLNLPSDQNYVGFVAQDVQKVFPEAVTTGKDGYLNFDMHSINVALVNAVRELKAQNDKLRTENELLKSNQAQMNARIGKIENFLKAEARK